MTRSAHRNGPDSTTHDGLGCLSYGLVVIFLLSAIGILIVNPSWFSLGLATFFTSRAYRSWVIARIKPDQWQPAYDDRMKQLFVRSGLGYTVAGIFLIISEFAREASPGFFFGIALVGLGCFFFVVPRLVREGDADPDRIN